MEGKKYTGRGVLIVAIKSIAKAMKTKTGAAKTEKAKRKIELSGEALDLHDRLKEALWPKKEPDKTSYDYIKEDDEDPDNIWNESHSMCKKKEEVRKPVSVKPVSAIPIDQVLDYIYKNHGDHALDMLVVKIPAVIGDLKQLQKSLSGISRKIITLSEQVVSRKISSGLSLEEEVDSICLDIFKVGMDSSRGASVLRQMYLKKALEDAESSKTQTHSKKRHKEVEINHVGQMRSKTDVT